MPCTHLPRPQSRQLTVHSHLHLSILTGSDFNHSHAGVMGAPYTTHVSPCNKVRGEASLPPLKNSIRIRTRSLSPCRAAIHAVLPRPPIAKLQEQDLLALATPAAPLEEEPQHDDMGDEQGGEIGLFAYSCISGPINIWSKEKM